MVCEAIDFVGYRFVFYFISLENECTAVDGFHRLAHACINAENQVVKTKNDLTAFLNDECEILTRKRSFFIRIPN